MLDTSKLYWIARARKSFSNQVAFPCQLEFNIRYACSECFNYFYYYYSSSSFVSRRRGHNIQFTRMYIERRALYLGQETWRARGARTFFFCASTVKKKILFQVAPIFLKHSQSLIVNENIRPYWHLPSIFQLGRIDLQKDDFPWGAFGGKILHLFRSFGSLLSWTVLQNWWFWEVLQTFCQTYYFP